MRSVILSAIKALFAVVVLLLTIEGLFYALADGAFRQGNYFVRDEALGVRMIPGADMRQRYLGAEPVVSIHINSAGYRGSDFPDGDIPEIAVVGDSLTFGLGVNDEETYVHRLDALLGNTAHVLNYGVPSYGPAEKEALVEEILATRAPRVVVFAVNFGRAFSPLNQTAFRPTAVNGRFVPPDQRDAGWPLPGWLVRHSHAVEVIRTWRFGEHAEPDDMRSATESRWGHLVKETERVMKERRRLQESGWFQLEGPDGSVRAWSSLSPRLRRLKTRCERANTALVLLLLPKDVQVTDAEWAKYNLEPDERRGVHVLAEDLLATAKALGIPAADTTPGLREASPGTFLTRDWHFSPMGHEVVASALHQTLIAHKLIPKQGRREDTAGPVGEGQP